MCRTNIEIDHINLRKKTGPMVNTHVSVDKSILLLSFVTAYPALLKIINCCNIKTYNCTHPLLSGLINGCTEQIWGSTRRFRCTFNEFEKQSLMKFDEVWWSLGLTTLFSQEVLKFFFSDKLINRRIVRESDLGYPGALGKI